MKNLNRIAIFAHLIFIVVIGLALICGTATAQDLENEKDEFLLEEITVTATFQETNLQKTPIAITAVTGDALEARNILTVADLGLIIPNSNIRAQGNASGPNATISLRGVGQGDFIPAFEPGVGIYVDDIYQETLIGSTLDLLDLERVEVLNGPQGTLFGKNSLGGAIRLISKVPRGDNTGHLEVTAGTYNRLDFNGAYDFSLIDGMLYARVSASSKRIDGYMDRLDYTCQMIANGTPELAGSFPQTYYSNAMDKGNCKIGEKGGEQSDAAKIMLRFLPTSKLEFNFGLDYTNMEMDPGAETLLRGMNPNDFFGTMVQSTFIDPAEPDPEHPGFNPNPGDAFTILGDTFVTGDPYTVYESFTDPITHKRWPDKNIEEHTNASFRVDYDITDGIHLKGIFGYREYQQQFTTANMTPMSLNAYLIDMDHDQTSYELRLNGSTFGESLDWTTGLYYFESNTYYGGFISLGTTGLLNWDGTPYGFSNNDSFTTESQSAFIHLVYHLTDQLSLTAGGRYTDEDKTFKFDHTGFLTVVDPLSYGQDHYDWKLSLDYQFTDDIMAYVMASTGFRSEGANPRPWTMAQLLGTSEEEILAYEIGAKTTFLDNRLRINMSAFYNKYDPRLFMQFGAQCSAYTSKDPGDFLFPYGTTCPEGTDLAGSPGQYWFNYKTSSGVNKGLDLDILAAPIDNLLINGSFGYFKFETDDNPGDPGYIHPDWKGTAEFSYNIGAQYNINFPDGSRLTPRLDMFYQGERNNNGSSSKPIEPYHVVPDYYLWNARLSYSPPSAKWTFTFEVKNLFDEFYWVNVGADRNDAGDALAYSRLGQPSPPRMFAVTFRRNFF